MERNRIRTPNGQTLHQLATIDNLRDLGGLRTTDGRFVQRGRLFRSGELASASAADRDYVASLGVGTVIDLRGPYEEAQRPDLAVAGADYHFLPLLDLHAARREDGVPFGEVYRAEPTAFFPMLYERLASSPVTAAAGREFFQLLLKPRGAVLWHCTQGKDRSGLMTLLVLTALGIDWQQALADYYLSNRQLAYQLAPSPRLSPAFMARLRSEVLVGPEPLAAWLARLDSLYGGLDGYLEQALGVGPAQRRQLQDLYLET